MITHRFLCWSHPFGILICYILLLACLIMNRCHRPYLASTNATFTLTIYNSCSGLKRWRSAVYAIRLIHTRQGCSRFSCYSDKSIIDRSSRFAALNSIIERFFFRKLLQGHICFVVFSNGQEIDKGSTERKRIFFFFTWINDGLVPLIWCAVRVQADELWRSMNSHHIWCIVVC